MAWNPEESNLDRNPEDMVVVLLDINLEELIMDINLEEESNLGKNLEDVILHKEVVPHQSKVVPHQDVIAPCLRLYFSVRSDYFFDYF